MDDMDMSFTDADTQKDKTELIDIVDENDIVIDTMPRSQAYAENRRKRIVYVFTVNQHNHEIVLAVRSKDVSWRPLHYSATVGGHVTSGESAQISARREMIEEIGLDKDVFLIEKYVTTDPTNGQKSMDNIFIAFAALDELTIDPCEVDRVEAMKLEKAILFASRNDVLLHPKLREQLDILKQNWNHILTLRG